MQTPRPDRFTYPPHGDSLGGYPADKARGRWIRAAFFGGLLCAFAVGFALTLNA